MDNLKNSFQNRFNALVEEYKNKTGASSKNAVYEKIYNSSIQNTKGKNTVTGISVSTLKKWENGFAQPNLKGVTALCEFFDCDPNYLFGYSDTKRDSNGELSKDTITNYNITHYGLDIKTLEILEEYKDTSIASQVDYQKQHVTNSNSNMAFSYQLNKLIQDDMWALVSLLQVISGKNLGLSSHGLDISTLRNLDKYIYDGKNVSYIQDFDEYTAITLLALKLYKRCHDKNYKPDSEHVMNTIDVALDRESGDDIRSGIEIEIDNYLSSALSARFKRLEDYINAFASDIVPEENN